MSKATFKQQLAVLCGMVLGGCLTLYAYRVQGGSGLEYVIAGTLLGGVMGLTAATRQLRLRYLGASMGSVAALTLFQLSVCDGTYIGAPLAGALSGAVLGLISEYFLKNESTQKTTPTSPPVDRKYERNE